MNIPLHIVREDADAVSEWNLQLGMCKEEFLKFITISLRKKSRFGETIVHQAPYFYCFITILYLTKYYMKHLFDSESIRSFS